MSEETRMELGLKEVLEECVLGIQSHLEDLQGLRRCCEIGDRTTAGCDAAISRTRAALAVVERWSAVEVEVKQTSPTAVVCQATYEDDGMGRAWGQRVELRDGEWTVNLKSAEYGEAGGVACLAAALECRRRNEGAKLGRRDCSCSRP